VNEHKHALFLVNFPLGTLADGIGYFAEIVQDALAEQYGSRNTGPYVVMAAQVPEQQVGNLVHGDTVAIEFSRV